MACLDLAEVAFQWKDGMSSMFYSTIQGTHARLFYHFFHLNIFSLIMVKCQDKKKSQVFNMNISWLRALVTFGLNALIGRKKQEGGDILWVGDWNAQNAREFMTYTVSKGYKIDSYELGNLIS